MEERQELIDRVERCRVEARAGIARIERLRADIRSVVPANADEVARLQAQAREVDFLLASYQDELMRLTLTAAALKGES